MMSRFGQRRDDGSALVLALVFLSLFGLVIAAVLSLAETSFRVTNAVRSQGSTIYSADGGIEAAIQHLRYSTEGAQGGTCNDFAVPINGTTVTVKCAPQAGSSVPAGVNNVNNKPKPAILTLATVASGEDGVYQASNAPLRITGDIYSHSTVRNDAAKALMTVDGKVSAEGQCLGSILSTSPPLRCSNTGNGQDASEAADPNYAHGVSSLAYQAVPACGATSKVDFYPGWYDSGMSLRNLMNGSCNKTFWFHPGDYLFDFTDPDPLQHEWLINNKDVFVVGGTPKGGWDTAGTVPSFPGSCKTGADAAPNDGVQFIFANDSRIHVAAGTVELCAKPSVSSQQIAIYGVKTTTGTAPTGTPSPGPSASATPSPMPTPTPTCSTPGVHYYLPNSATATAGNKSTTWNNPSTLPNAKQLYSPPDFSESPNVFATSSISSGNFAEGNFSSWLDSSAAGVPTGCAIDSVTLFVRHSETAPSNVQNIKLTSSVAAINIVAKRSGCVAGDFCVDGTQNPVDMLDLKASGVTSAALVNGLTLSYRVDASNGASVTESLDGLGLKIELSEPPTPSPSPAPTPTAPGGSTTNYFRAGSGCITKPVYSQSDNTTCALVKTDGSQTRFALQGTIYAPLAAVDIAMTNVSSQILGRGVVVRTLRLSITPSSTYSGATVAVPADSSNTVTNRRVTLSAYIDGITRIRAVVQFDDGGGANVGQGVIVESWSVLP